MSIKPKVALSQDFLLNLARLPGRHPGESAEMGYPLPDRPHRQRF